MSKFKVGDKVIAINTYRLYSMDQDQFIKQGRVYTVKSFTEDTDWLVVSDGENTKMEGCYGYRFELAEEQILENAFDKAVEHTGATILAKSLIEKGTQMTAEQLREEIIRIDARIEEAKKDIENANVERNSLVEKLREKGFEMVEKTTQLSDQPFLEIGAHYVINEKNSSTWMEKGVEVRCVDIDPSSRKLDARVEDHLGNGDWVNSECLTKI